LSIGGNGNGIITVDNITAANSANLSGTTYITATRDNARIIFSNNASYFPALSMGADDGIAVNVDLTTTVGNLQMNGDYAGNVDTYDNIDIAGGVTLSSAHDLVLNATTGGILLSGANGSTVTLDANGDGLLYIGAPIMDTNNANLTANSEGNITLYGATNLGTGNYTFTSDNDNDGTTTLAINGAFTGNSTLTFSSGGTGTNDTLDVNYDITANALTIQNFSPVDLAAGVDLTTNNGALDSGSTNVGVINLSGGNGTANIIDGNGDAAVILTGITDTNNPNLTVTSEGDLQISGGTNWGTGTYSFTSDNDNDGASTFNMLAAMTGNSAVTFSGGGIGTNDSRSIGRR
jgi:hypothetical protein